MAIKVNNNTVIDDSRNLTLDSLTFSNGNSYVTNLEKIFSGGQLIHTINNPNADQSTNTSDLFGFSVAISGNRAIVGAYLEDIPYDRSGSAYIFDVDTGALLHTINDPNASQTSTFNDNFGYSVAIDGNRAIVGASGEGVPYTFSGSAYIIDVDTGAVLHTINNPNADQTTNTSDQFGNSVAISGNRAIVGAYQEDVPYQNSGSAYIIDVNTGAVLHTINNPNADQSTNTVDTFGFSVAISGNRAIVGAYQEDIPYSASGSVYIFDVDTGALLHTINNPNADQSTNSTDYFGYSVAISGNRAIVGARSEDIPYNDSGTVYIIDVETGAVLHTINNPNADQTSTFFDQFGWSVGIDGNRAIVGASLEDLPYTDSGSAYIIDVNTGAVLHTINNPNADQTTSVNDNFGYSVAISGNRAIVGARYEDVPYTDSGSAYILSVNDAYRLTNVDSLGELSVRSRIFEPTRNFINVEAIPSPAAVADNFPDAVAISGNRMIVGASESPTPYTASGRIYIMNYDTGEVLHTINNPNADQSTNPQDYFGYSVAISGNRAIVGAYQEDIPYSNGGSAYIFAVDTGQLLFTINNPNTDLGTELGDIFGWAVAISGDRAIVSARGEDLPYSGGGTVYIINVNTGAVIRTINNPNADQTTQTLDYFGRSVAISGNRAIVSAYQEDIPYTESGTVYIINVDTGAVLHTINNPNADQTTTTFDLFGWSVDIDGNRAIVGARSEDVPYSGSGTAYIFDVDTGAVLHTLINPNADQSTNTLDYFGWSVAISGNRAIVGAIFEDIPYTSSGAAYIFDVDTGQLVATITNPNFPNNTTSDFFAEEVAIDGNRVAFTATGELDPFGVLYKTKGSLGKIALDALIDKVK